MYACVPWCACVTVLMSLIQAYGETILKRSIPGLLSAVVLLKLQKPESFHKLIFVTVLTRGAGGFFLSINRLG